MPDFTLRQLECFVAVAEHATIAHAAEALHASASAVSAALEELEKHLGEQLLVRRRAHGITLTTAGRALLPRARAVLSAARDLTPSADGRLTGRLTLGCYRTLAASLLPRLIEGFTREHPLVGLDFIEGSGEELLRAIEEGRADAGILYDRDIHEELETLPLQNLRAHVLLAADHRLAGAERISLRELAGEPFIQFDVQPAWQNTLALMAEAGVRPAVRYVTANYELARSLVSRGLGYSVLVNRPATDISHEGRRVVVKEIDPVPEPTTVVLATRRDRAPTAVLRAFLDWAPEELRGA
ncbi:LysR substrate-binding domain-containing protein [Sciscionella sediminilitoris]|uniref:LysR substrate-binding domain-containing protein n=1 Tax=Sciscionella sediminilitoris TaxID=1445613 RepID=UPI0004DED568|nr:LysR substrate-binding domain-containing protein [Sciscionella sp. SE31]